MSKNFLKTLKFPGLDKIYDIPTTAEDVGARSSNWLPTIAEIGAAPAGCGLGGTTAPFNYANIDNVKANGWYRCTCLDTYMGGITFHYAYMRVDAWDMNSLTQTLFPVGIANISLMRTCIDGVWQEWEWVNPPMIKRVEYRTTERYNAKPVYAYALPLGTLPNAGDKDVAHGIDDVDEFVSCTGTASDGRTMPFYGKYTKIYISAVGENVCVSTLTDETAMTGTAIIKYTKTTD